MAREATTSPILYYNDKLEGKKTPKFSCALIRPCAAATISAHRAGGEERRGGAHGTEGMRKLRPVLALLSTSVV
jgi:hypothetical protein